MLLLPYLEGGDAIYQQFHLDEPWDSKHNKELISCMPSVYRHPKEQSLARERPTISRRAARRPSFPAPRALAPATFPTAPPTRSCSVEACDESAVPWTKPDDFDCGDADPMGKLLGRGRTVFSL